MDQKRILLIIEISCTLLQQTASGAIAYHPSLAYAISSVMWTFEFLSEIYQAQLICLTAGQYENDLAY
jgi:hypothetical protein